MTATTITIQIHPTRPLYRFVGPQGASKSEVSFTELQKKIRFVYGQTVEVKQEIATF